MLLSLVTNIYIFLLCFIFYDICDLVPTSLIVVFAYFAQNETFVKLFIRKEHKTRKSDKKLQILVGYEILF
jgi:hypothetical protein